jgi:hypothetical protein
MPRRRLDEPTIRRILQSPASHGVLARELGVHRSAISQIRLGKIHAAIAPELPRWQPDLSCCVCIHWHPGDKVCSLDFPDPVLEGPQFARECSTFLRCG